ncbi:hypothetical protein JT358_16795 [Micrococcales bacterium 31B]|nr:hypothetical protein [Micrococcales bacterium 31B]
MATATAIAAVGFLSSVNAAFASEMYPSALDHFRSNLEQKATAGDVDAIADLQRLRALSPAQEQKLALILNCPISHDTPGITSESHASVSVRPTTSTTLKSGSASTTSAQATQSLFNVTATCDANYVFAGITVSEVRLTAFYETNGSIVTRHFAKSGTVLKNLQWATVVSFPRFTNYVSSGKGYFSGTVRVERGVGDWFRNQSEGNLAMRVNGGKSAIEYCGWQ